MFIIQMVQKQLFHYELYLSMEFKKIKNKIENNEGG
jgi:hypothetical protein